MNIIVEKPWNYTLYSSSQGFIISVVCGGIAVYELQFYLNNDEIKNMRENTQYLDSLAEKVRENTQEYNKRSLNKTEE